MSNVTKLEGLKLHEVSLVTKGANGEMFEIIKADNSSDPVEILKALMKNPETMDEADKEILEDMGGDQEAYNQYVDEFAPEFIKDLESQGTDVAKFINEMAEDRTGNQEAPEKENNSEDQEDQKEENNSEDQEVKKGILEKATDIVKNFFGGNKEVEDENSEIEKSDLENTESTEGEEEMKAETIAKVLGDALAPVAQAIEKMNERITTIENNVNGEEVEKMDKCEKCGNEKGSEKCEKCDSDEVKKSDSDVIAEAIAKALDPVSKSLQNVSERINNIEKQERPSSRIPENNEDVKKSAPLWGSFQLGNK